MHLDRARSHALLKLVSGFAVIVLGVLVALAGDRWNQSRQDGQLETDYLAGVIADLVVDSGMIELEIEQTRLREEASRRVLQVFEGDAPDSELTSIGWFDLAGPSAQPLSASWTFQELQSTGNVRLISDRRLRRVLFEYYGVVAFQRERMTYIQSLGRDGVSELMWAEGGPYSGATVADLAGQPGAAAELERLVSYHTFRRELLATWGEAAGQALAVARSVAER